MMKPLKVKGEQQKDLTNPKMNPIGGTQTARKKVQYITGQQQNKQDEHQTKCIVQGYLN